mgnify:CR=1 FL=1
MQLAYLDSFEELIWKDILGRPSAREYRFNYRIEEPLSCNCPICRGVPDEDPVFIGLFEYGGLEFYNEDPEEGEYNRGNFWIDEDEDLSDYNNRENRYYYDYSRDDPDSAESDAFLDDREDEYDSLYAYY